MILVVLFGGALAGALRTSLVPLGGGASLDAWRALLQDPVLPDARMHADLIDPFAFEQFLRFVAVGLDFDVMLEAKGKDLALMRLREQLVARGIRFRHGDDTPSGHRCRTLVP